ncbi:MAG: carboxylesterase/lipase family protein [Streptomycetaceae bacterium]|nr:carboxylesterase/lipase family protein [Mycobacteriaceae bacterium]NUS55381.1 carboxylesterase/lipase family protein [Streptomycetaceae bacterium]
MRRGTRDDNRLQRPPSEATINTDAGVVRGTRGPRVSRWRSIPYAEPPVGQLRFVGPQPVKPWSGVRDATVFGNAAMQFPGGARTGLGVQAVHEDCLTINVTAPTAPATAPRPVIVFIHGGGNLFGTSALALYSGGRLAVTGDLVFVSFNYRLGAFGYLDFTEFATARHPFESNLGLRDQVAALEWVRRNIAAFGGDPANVTIMGESAGANAVRTLLATPAAGGLFHRAIAESVMNGALSADDAARFARRCVTALGADRDSAPTLLAEADAAVIGRAVGREINRAMRERPGFMPVTPVVDGAWLPEHPADAVAAGRGHAVPLIIGSNRDEGTLFAKHLDQLPTTPDRLQRLFDQAGAGHTERLRAAYPDWDTPAGAIRLGGDYTFWRPSVHFAGQHTRHAPTYVYRYDYAPRAMRLTGYGAAHGSELFAVFGFGETPAGRLLTAPGGRRDLRRVTRLIQGHWTHFARHGTPGAGWPAYTPGRRTLIIDTAVRVNQDPEADRRLALDALPRPTLGPTEPPE